MSFLPPRRVPLVLGTLVLSLQACGGGAPASQEPAAKKGAATAKQEAPKPAETTPGIGAYKSPNEREKPITPLLNFARKGDVELAKKLLEQGSTDPNAALADGLTPLHVAVGEGHKEFVALLLDHGADPNRQQAAGATALHIALDQNRPDLVGMLLEKGANPNLQDKEFGLAPLHILCRTTFDPAVRLALADQLVAKGADVDLQMKNGSTPLQLACDKGLVDLATFLLDHKASLEIKGPEGYTALHFAAAKKSLELCKLLVERGADVNAKSDGKATPAQIAARDENAELLTYFQSHGAKFDTKPN